MLAIRLPEDIEKRLDRLAKRTGRTKTYYAREAVLAHIEDLEDTYLAEAALEDIRAGRSKAVPLESAMKKQAAEAADTPRRRTPAEVQAAIHRAQELMRSYREPGRSLVDELLAERRAEAARE
jgi:RHH-type rel operon transcriptional repressor/antitoxin RelB